MQVGGSKNAIETRKTYEKKEAKFKLAERCPLFRKFHIFLMRLEINLYFCL